MSGKMREKVIPKAPPVRSGPFYSFAIDAFGDKRLAYHKPGGFRSRANHRPLPGESSWC